jgi:hypothetical protein
VGRTSAVAGAWLIAQGGAANDAARMYVRFRTGVEARRGLRPTGPDAEERVVGRSHAWWGFLELARALGDPITEAFDFPPPTRPPEADRWARSYEQALQPWRRPQP